MYPRSFLLPLAVVLLGLVLTGCWTSAYRMDPDQIATGTAPDNVKVELVPITPQLIVEQEKQRPVPRIPTELLTTPQIYRIGAGDVLFITVWDHPELTVPSGSQQQIISNGRTVHPNGELFYPHVGTVMAMGMTLLELSSKLTVDLAKYIENPQVDVSVLSFESQKVLVSGALANSTPIRITTTPLSLVQALGQAGVVTAEADLSEVILTRGGRQYTLDVYQLTRVSTDIQRLYLQDGDRIHVSYNDNKKVFMLGEVKSPMALAYREHTLSLSSALSAAGGLDHITSNGNSVYVIRGMSDIENQPAKIFQLHAESATGFILASRFVLQPQDVVYVGATDITYWNRVIAQLIPTATLLNIGTNTLLDLKDIEREYFLDNNN